MNRYLEQVSELINTRYYNQKHIEYFTQSFSENIVNKFSFQLTKNIEKDNVYKYFIEKLVNKISVENIHNIDCIDYYKSDINQKYKWISFFINLCIRECCISRANSVFVGEKLFYELFIHLIPYIDIHYYYSKILKLMNYHF